MVVAFAPRCPRQRVCLRLSETRPWGKNWTTLSGQDLEESGFGQGSSFCYAICFGLSTCVLLDCARRAGHAATANRNRAVP